ncbi:MAG: hypothetical protein A3J28_13045 [Acidobacteria bacterium RIFCSPLOWO2_12_FULL_60_22]|nr:MAG: hypothetical protein A3J28_13045 [Acidobacteria bacterium RIFCSPLOWO2_12_FULL_60_22]
MFETVNLPAFSVEFWHDKIKFPSITAVISAIDSIGNEISQLQQARISCRNEERYIRKCTHLPPACCASPKFASQDFQALTIRRFCNDDYSALFFPVLTYHLRVLATQKPVKSVSQFLESTFVWVFPPQARLLYSCPKQNASVVADNLINICNQLPALFLC